MRYEHLLATVSDDELLGRLVEILGQTRRNEADLVAHIGEFDSRLLYARQAFPSMFAYCTEALHLSEAEAYLRINTARAAREHPVLLDMLADGRLHLAGIAKLAPHLTASNRDSLLLRATHKTKREIEELLVEIAPRPDVPAVVRRLPMPVARSLAPTLPAPPQASNASGGSAPQLRPDGVASSVTSGPAPTIQPLAPSRYRVQFTANASLHDKLERLQALLPGRDLAALIEQAVTEKLDRLETKRFGKAKVREARPTDPFPSSRYVPAAVRRAVTDRDGHRCRFVDEEGRRCPERHRLEFHHREPYGVGGDRGVPNIALLCRAHNQFMADCDYGRAKMSRHRIRKQSSATVP